MANSYSLTVAYNGVSVSILYGSTQNETLITSSMLALTSHSFTLYSAFFHSTSHRFPSSARTCTRPSSVCASMEQSGPDFPYLPPAHRALMLNVLATVDDGLSSALLPSSVPPDILRFQNPQGSAYGSVNIRTGSQTSPVLYCILLLLFYQLCVRLMLKILMNKVNLL